MIFVAYGEKSLCDKGIPVWSVVLCVGVVNLSKSIAVVFQRGTHMMVIWWPLILITCPKFDSLLNELELSISVLLF